MLRNAALGADFRAIDGNPTENFLLLPKKDWVYDQWVPGPKKEIPA
jgi:hypothetical protein